MKQNNAQNLKRGSKLEAFVHALRERKEASLKELKEKSEQRDLAFNFKTK